MDDELKAILDKLLLGQESLAQGQNELRAMVMERFERVEDRLTAMGEDISVNMMAVMHQHGLRRANGTAPTS